MTDPSQTIVLPEKTGSKQSLRLRPIMSRVFYLFSSLSRTLSDNTRQNYFFFIHTALLICSVSSGLSLGFTY